MLSLVLGIFSHSLHRSAPAMPLLKAVNWTVPQDLVSMIEDIAVVNGTSIDETVVSLLHKAVEQYTVRGSGRCSLRTGLHSEGPRPLPLQQP